MGSVTWWLATILWTTADPCASAGGEITIKTPSATFNLMSPNTTGAPRLLFRIVDGRICSADVDRPGGPWKLFAGTGQPQKDVRVEEISADGRNLIAIDGHGVVHYTKIDDVDWRDDWLSLPVLGPLSNLVTGGKLQLPHNRGWSVSHRGPENAYYEDIAGKRHPIGAGVTTLYVLTIDGTRIVYADPWLPNGFNNIVLNPNNGRFVAESMSASASTLFILARVDERHHHMFTRLIDFDTEGNNPFLNYTYSPSHEDDDDVRALPAEPWRAQPAIALTGDARISKHIAIAQTGKGNGARELRVSGTDHTGRLGYYRKMLNDSDWAFVYTGIGVDESAFEIAPVSHLGPKPTHCTLGSFTSKRYGGGAVANLSGFVAGSVDTRIQLIEGTVQTTLKVYSRRRLSNLMGSTTPSYTLVAPELTAQHWLWKALGEQKAVPVNVRRKEKSSIEISPKALRGAHFSIRFDGCSPED